MSELAEPPSYFNREVLQAFQLSFRQLGNYIQELRTAGFDVSTLTVQWYAANRHEMPRADGYVPAYVEAVVLPS